MTLTTVHMNRRTFVKVCGAISLALTGLKATPTQASPLGQVTLPPRAFGSGSYGQGVYQDTSNLYGQSANQGISNVVYLPLVNHQ